MSAADAAIKDHQAWLGYLQPDGLVVSPAALVDAQVVLDRNSIPVQQRFHQCVEEVQVGELEGVSAIPDFPAFLRNFLAWPDDCVLGIDPARPLPDALHVPLPEFGETLVPSLALRDPKPKDESHPWLLLVQTLPLGTDLDALQSEDQRSWSAAPARRFIRLLRETKVPIGLLANGTHIRLIYAPRGENPGSLTFPVEAMSEIAGRAIVVALELLLNRYRLLAAPSNQRLPALLQRSREYQSTVSTRLAQQVLDALYELLRGFQAASERTQGVLLRDVLAKNPDDVYNALLSVLLRNVFLLYAEDRGLLPSSALYVRNYSVHGLFERLRTDYERHPDTMDSRFGAWAQLLALFRAVHDGCKHPEMQMPARHGHLFNPQRFPFLEGRVGSQPAVPLVSDGVLFRVLQKLLILDGERLSYRTLDVEQIGSVYETMMGFRLEVASGPSIAIKPSKAHGAPAAINLEQLLAANPGDRAKWLLERTDQKFEGVSGTALKNAQTIDDLLAALEKKIARNATPAPVATGTIILQPSDERRRSGSHYTPRSFTEPIVRKTLEPILKRLGEKHTPEQILDLKVCDQAVGSGAFLVETCRQLGDALVKAWHYHGQVPAVPPDEDEILHARRMVAQRCLYGVDRNPMAADLAKLSLWLATLAKNHPFTFLDHAIRSGDSLVGLTRRQIETFSWKSEFTTGQLWEQDVRKRVSAALRERHALIALDDDYISPQLKAEKLRNADADLETVRFIGDAAVAAFFSADKDKAREAKREELVERISDYLGRGNLQQRPTEEVKALRCGQFPVTPFHWEIEFPEVFDRQNPGFDAVVGNPPFLGGLRVSNMLGMQLFAYLTDTFSGAGHLCDLVAYFFRKGFAVLRSEGCAGLVATNSIAQGDTRSGGLAWICEHGGEIYNAIRRQRWPGQAAVVVSIIHLCKGRSADQPSLDHKLVSRITAYLFTAGGNQDPARLAGMNDLFSQGTNIRSPGFLIGDDGEATSNADIVALLRQSPASGQRIFPYLGGEDINSHPSQEPNRQVIYLSDIRQEAELDKWPELTAIVRKAVKPERDALGSNPNNIPLKRRWWAYHADRLDFYRDLDRVLVLSQVGAHCAFTFQPTNRVFGNTLNLFRISTFSGFSLLQSRIHDGWARFFASTMKDDLRYTPSDCFETFPFPIGFETDATLEAAGREYYEFRAALMVRNNEGLTKTYNRFHDPEESALDIHRLRELHAQMDSAVLTAYGWADLLPRCACAFILDYEDEEESETEGKPRKRKKPYRHRWPDDVRDEVLARLLKLNAERAMEEELAGAAAALVSQASAKKTSPAKKAKTIPENQLGLGLPALVPATRKHSKGINFKRGAIAAYAVDRLGHRWEFGRTQMEKVLYCAQHIVGVDLEMEFQHFAAGPFNQEIHKLESLAGKEEWFSSVPRSKGKGTEYRPGPKISDRVEAAVRILGEKQTEFDRVLNCMAKMNSEKAGIWTTTHAVWRERVMSGKSVTDDTLVQDFYAFHSEKTKIEESRIRACIQWMRDNDFVPRAPVLVTERVLPDGFRLPCAEPLLYTTNLVISLLSEAGGSLAWPRLLDSFILATSPKLMQRFATAEEAARVEAWASRWNEKVVEGLLLPSLNQLGGRNLTVSQSADGPVFQLLDGPRKHANEDVGYDAWLALRIATVLAPDAIEIPYRKKWTKEAIEMVFA